MTLKLKYLGCLLLLSIVFACNQGEKNASGTTTQQSEKAGWTPPPTGSKVATLKEKMEEDHLNNLYFAVTVFSTDSSKYGIYKATLYCAYAQHDVRIQLPKWNKPINLKPVLKKGEGKYSINLGFEAEDTVFHPLYSIAVIEHALKMSKDWDYNIVQ